jgi:hypothetical protein
LRGVKSVPSRAARRMTRIGLTMNQKRAPAASAISMLCHCLRAFFPKV